MDKLCIYIYVIDANVWRLCRIRQHSEIGIINPAFRINKLHSLFESPPCKIRSSTTEVSAMNLPTGWNGAFKSMNAAILDATSTSIKSQGAFVQFGLWLFRLLSRTFSLGGKWVRRHCRHCRPLARREYTLNLKNMWIFHNFPAVVSEAVRTCPRLLHNHIHQNHRKSVWLVGLPMGLNVGKGHNQPIYQKSNAWIIFLAIYLSICHVTSEIFLQLHCNFSRCKGHGGWWFLVLSWTF